MQTIKEEAKGKGKREGGSPPLQAPPKKKFFGFQIENGSPSTPNQQGDFVVEFQKKAMLVNLEQKKIELNSLNQKIKQYEEKQKFYEQNLGILGSARNQLKENLKLMLGRLKPISEDSGPYQSNLFQKLLHCTEEKNFEGVLLESSKELFEVLEQIIMVFEKEINHSNHISSLLKENIGGQDSKVQALIETNQKLEEKIKAMTATSENFQIRHQQIISQNDLLTNETTILKEQLKSLENQMFNLQESLEISNKRLIREQMRHKEEIEKLKKQGNGNNISIQSTQVKKEENIDVDSQLLDLKEEAQSRQDYIKKLENEKLDLLKEIQVLKREVEVIPIEKILKSQQYQLLEQQFGITLSELDSLRFKYEKLNTEYENTRSFIKTNKEKAESTMGIRQASLEKRLREAEFTISKLTIEKGNLDTGIQMNSQSLNQILKEQSELMNSKDQELKKLKKELENQKEKFKKAREDSEKIILKHVDEIKDLNFLIRELRKRVEDAKLLKKKYEEKEKMNQYDERRDVREILASEKVLLEENTKLKSLLEKLQEDSRKLEESERVVSDLKSQCESQEQEIQALASEIEVIGGHFEEMQEQNARLLQQLGEKEDILSKLMSDQMKSQSLQKKYTEENDLLDQQLKKSEEKYRIQQEVMEKLKDTIHLLQEQIKKTLEENKLLGSSTEMLKRSANTNSQLANELKAKLEKIEKDYEETKKKLDEKVLEVERLSQQNSKLDDEVKSIQRKYERITSKGEGKAYDTFKDEQLKFYKDKLTCNICNDKEKSVVIARCFHTFCRGCVEASLSRRSRKCPSCKKAFAENDVKDIWF